jgi:hypothetical protein
MTYQIKAIELLSEVSHHLFHLFEATKITSHPVNISTRGLLTNLFDSFFSLILLSIDHDHFGFGLRELARDLEARESTSVKTSSLSVLINLPDAIGTTCNDRSPAREVMEFLFGTDDCMKCRLHFDSKIRGFWLILNRFSSNVLEDKWLGWWLNRGIV